MRRTPTTCSRSSTTGFPPTGNPVVIVDPLRGSTIRNPVDSEGIHWNPGEIPGFHRNPGISTDKYCVFPQGNTQYFLQLILRISPKYAVFLRKSNGFPKNPTDSSREIQRISRSKIWRFSRILRIPKSTPEPDPRSGSRSASRLEIPATGFLIEISL